eukprot:m.391034 g.391034  ORF g.391034 m.391034 type:complete len:196 (+) comp20079_c0_seq10:125-712(+)
MAFPMIFLWSALAPLLASVFLVPSGTGPATQPLTTAGARGTLVQLSQGRVHYDLDLAEPGDDGAAPPLAVFVHGFSLDMTVWDKTAPVVRQQGWSTICLDLYGRGYSDAPGSHQTAELFVGQLAELLLVVAPHSHMVLIGESMGGAIVAKFAQVGRCFCCQTTPFASKRACPNQWAQTQHSPCFLRTFHSLTTQK